MKTVYCIFSDEFIEDTKNFYGKKYPYLADDSVEVGTHFKVDKYTRKLQVIAEDKNTLPYVNIDNGKFKEYPDGSRDVAMRTISSNDGILLIE